MTPVTQTVLATDVTIGNCWAACLASILECPLETLPQPQITESGEAYEDRMKGWLDGMGWHLSPAIVLNEELDGLDARSQSLWAAGYSVLVVKSPRGGKHAVVQRDGKIVWDPHPDRARGVGRWFYLEILIPHDPSAWRPI